MSGQKVSVGDSNVIATRVEPPQLTQHATDLAVKPGFRAPANKKSKAQKKKKKK